MKILLAFMKKEVLAQLRSVKTLILMLLFVLFGLMNPIAAKITPWLLDTLSAALAESGMKITGTTVSALDSWMQFFKNMPMALIAFVLLESNIFTREYQTGTLILVLTKGIPRCRVLISKTVVLICLWTIGFLLCFGITWGGSACFWADGMVQSLGFSALCWWLFGLWVIVLTVLFSAIASSNILVLAGTGGVVLLSTLIGMLPKISRYLPTQLSDGTSLIYGVAETRAYVPAILITAVFCTVAFSAGILIFNKKQL